MNYTYSDLLGEVVDSQRFEDVANNLTIRTAINRGVRGVVREMDLKSMKRKAALARIFNDIYDCTCPTDLKALIDLQPQSDRDSNSRVTLTTEEQFDRKKEIKSNLVTVSYDDMTRKVRASLDVDDTSISISDGTWSLFGDAENVDDMTFDISSAGGVTAGIQNSTITDFDLTGYTSIFVWANITSPADITNYILRIGNDASNYYSITTTAQADGNAFVEGKNLLQFNLSDKTEVGTVDETTCDYVVIHMTKDAGKVSETGYGFYDLQIHTGQLMNAVYYTKFGWQTSAGVYIENSTAVDDYINADTEEFDLFVQKCKIEVFKDLKEFDLMKLAQSEYADMKKVYGQKYPSERLLLTQKY